MPRLGMIPVSVRVGTICRGSVTGASRPLVYVLRDAAPIDINLFAPRAGQSGRRSTRTRSAAGPAGRPAAGPAGAVQRTDQPTGRTTGRTTGPGRGHAAGVGQPGREQARVAVDLRQ